MEENRKRISPRCWKGASAGGALKALVARERSLALLGKAWGRRVATS
jgi:hypothetical protein